MESLCSILSWTDRYPSSLVRCSRLLVYSVTVSFHPDADLVDMTFGTGAVKITPAHDPNDYLCGKRHGLEFIIVLTEDGKIAANGGPFAGERTLSDIFCHSSGSVISVLC